jgi:hypothetical protein
MRLISRSLAVLALATAAIVGGLASPASAAPASTQAAAAATYTETTLNLGLRLTHSNAGTVIASKPAAGDNRQRWVEPGRTVYVNGVAKGGYELRPSNLDNYCVTDKGLGQRVVLTACSSTGLATQVWLWTTGRSVNGKSYYFWINAQTGGKLMFDAFTGEGTYPSFIVISSPTKFNSGTAGEACQLWTEQ